MLCCRAEAAQRRSRGSHAEAPDTFRGQNRSARRFLLRPRERPAVDGVRGVSTLSEARIPKAEAPARRSWLALAVAALAAAVYLNSLAGGFVWDDRYLIVDNPRLRSLSGVWESFRSDYFFTAETNLAYGYYRPLSAVSLWIDHRIWGFDPTGFHLTNVLLHAICAALVVVVVRRLGLGRAASAVAGVLFAVHPIHTENVSWISGRTDVLALALSLASLLAYLRSRDEDAKRPAVARATSLLLFASAILAKEMAAVLPLWIACIAWIGERRSWRKSVRAAVPWLVVLAGYVFLRFVVLCVRGPDVPAAHDLASALLTAPWTVLRYLSWLVAPVDLTSYVQNPYVRSVAEPRFWGSLLALGAIGQALVRLGRSRPEIRLFAAMLAVAFAPVLNLQRVAGQEDMGAVMAERFLYFPSVPFAALAALAATGLFAALRRAPARATATAAFVIVAAAAAGQTWARTRDWHDERTLFEREARRNPGVPAHWIQLAQVALRSGRLEEADGYLRRAEALDPRSVGVVATRAQWLVFAGRYDEALRLQRVVVATIGKRNHASRNNLAFLLRRAGRTDEARVLLEGLVTSLPEYADPHFNLGELFREQGELDRAAAEFRRYRELRPEDPRGLTSLGDVEAVRGHRAEVESLYADELASRRPVAPTLNSLAGVRHRMGDTEGAREALARALAADPGYVLARFNLAQLLDEEGRRAEAVAELERVARESPASEAGRAAATQLDAWRRELSSAGASPPGDARP